MKCNDCIYFKRCVVLGVELDMNHDKEADKNCRHFKNKADFKEIVHGKWENMTDIDSAYLNTYRCSACGTTFWIDEIPKDANYNHCPNCGAKMDKEQENNV